MVPPEIRQQPHVSFSQLDTYLRCPLKYRFAYIDRIPPDFVPAALAFGSGIHGAVGVEKRLARWEARSQGAKPKTFSSEISYPTSHPAPEVLRRYQGVLSGAFVHFTPEFVEGQGWRHKTREASGRVELPYLEVK